MRAEQAPTLRGHDVRAGISYNRLLPGSPRTRFGFGFGSVTAQQPGTVRVDMTGTAFLSRQLSPDWLTAAIYTRGFDVRAGLVEPLYYFSDTAALTLAGTIARRAALRLVGSYVRGELHRRRQRGRASFVERHRRDQPWRGESDVRVCPGHGEHHCVCRAGSVR